MSAEWRFIACTRGLRVRPAGDPVIAGLPGGLQGEAVRGWSGAVPSACGRRASGRRRPWR